MKKKSVNKKIVRKSVRKRKKILFLILIAFGILGIFFAGKILAENAAIWEAAFRDFSSALFPAKCPSDMVWVSTGKFCVDKYEASKGGGSYKIDMNGDGDFLDVIDVYGNNEAGTNWTESSSTTEKAVSVSGANPWVSVNQVNAKAACMASGKRLCTGYEWLLAGKGTPDIDSSAPAAGTESCQIWNTGSWPDYSGKKPDGSTWTDNPAGTNSIKTGTATSCVSDAGAYDLIGNVWEWTDNVINNGLHPVTGAALPAQSGVRSIDIYGIPDETGSTTSDYNYDYFYINTDGYRGMIRGGSWDHGALAGVFALALNCAPSPPAASGGFRCCK